MTEEQTIQVTTKNPKKVEAGKRLAEYNRKKREELKAGAAIQQDDMKAGAANHQDGKRVLEETIPFLGGAIALTLIGIYLVYKKKKSTSETRVSESQPTNEKNNKFEME